MPSSLQPLRALAVDDDVFFIEIVRDMLSLCGIEDCRTASDGVEALAMLAEHGPPPDLILCDIDMFGMDGIEFTRHLAARNYEGGIAIMSGSSPRLHRTLGDLIGERRLLFLGTLQKPFAMEELEGVLSRLRAAPRKSAAIRPREAPSPVVVTPDELREGIATDRVRLHYQPKIRLDTNRVIGAEALLRWTDPVRGIIPPLSIVPVAEEHGLIHQLTQSVFAAAARQQAAWQRSGLDLMIAVNISADDLLHYDLPDRFGRLVEQAGANSAKLTLEVTEGRLMTNMASGMEVIARLRLMGFNFSIDDFGTGYSNQEKLRRLPFDEIKIDRSFVSGAIEDATRRAIVESNVTLAHALGMSVVAEGAESEADCKLLRSLACDEVQGFYFCKPVAPELLISWKDEWEAVNALD
jgi:EAL domain-containing protein (putative c-di-GMP-specific phosphodiesterase class I)